MQNQIRKLLKLQEVDEDIEKIARELSELPRKLNRKKEILSNLESDLKEVEEELNEIKGEMDSKEQEQKTEVERKRSLEANLRVIKTVKEYNAIMREIGFAKKAIEEYDRELEDLLEDLEKIENEYNQRKEKYDVLLKEITELEDIVSKRSSELQSQLEKFEEERKQFLEEISPVLLRKYEMLKNSMQLPVVVPVVDEICQGCFMNVPPQMYIQLQRAAHGKEESKEIFTCPNCMRIIYYDINNEVEEEGG